MQCKPESSVRRREKMAEGSYPDNDWVQCHIEATTKNFALISGADVAECGAVKAL